MPMFSSAFRLGSVIVTASLAAALCGCGSGIHGVFPDPTSETKGGNVTGNWQFAFEPAANTPALSSASGSIDQSGGTTTDGQFTTAVLLVSAPCYSSGMQLPTQGFATTNELTLNSFGDVGQYLNFALTIADGGAAMSGTYTVQNGCAAGAHGTLSGTRYLPLTGTYAGALTGAASRSAMLALQQSTDQAGDGGFLLSGTATFTGFTCFAKGTTTTPVGGEVSGAAATAHFTTDDPAGSSVDVTGTFDAAAKTLTVSGYTIHGGACDGQTGTGTLNLQ